MRLSIAIPLLAGLVGLGGCAVTPSPLTDQEISGLAGASFARVMAEQEPVAGVIDLYEAMARALKYNLDQRVEMMTAAVRTKELNLAHFSLLPGAVANTGYIARDNDNASNSINVLTGEQSLATSTSQERRLRTGDVALSWNILDFGLSYVRARQSADKLLIAEEMRRKVIARIVEDVRTAYWRAVSADRLIHRLGDLEGRIRRAQHNAHGSSVDRQTSPITAATYERELVEIKRAIHELQRDLVVSRSQLAALMNLRPGTRFKLAGGATSRPPRPTIAVDQMIQTALQNRAELKEVWYQRRINGHELDAALLELLPGLTPYVGTNVNGTLNLTRVCLGRQLEPDPPAHGVSVPASGNTDA